MLVFLETFLMFLGISSKIPLILKSHSGYLKTYFFQWWIWQFPILSEKSESWNIDSLMKLFIWSNKNDVYIKIHGSESCGQVK